MAHPQRFIALHSPFRDVRFSVSNPDWRSHRHNPLPIPHFQYPNPHHPPLAHTTILTLSRADKPGSTITFSDIEVHGGTLSLYYLRAGRQGLGNFKCWADNNKNAATTLVGPWSYVAVGGVGVVATNLPAGKHSMTCEVLDESVEKENPGHTVKIIAVLAS